MAQPACNTGDPVLASPQDVFTRRTYGPAPHANRARGRTSLHSGEGMRLIVHRERPHPRVQLRFTDLDGLRLPCFASNTKGGYLADLELRHRRRARCGDRIRNARDTGPRNLPCTTAPVTGRREAPALAPLST